MNTTGYMFDTADEGERDRLRAHALMWDRVTRRRIGEAGITEGWRCLEVGAGSGTMTRWLSGQVGDTGHVVALDLETRWLEDVEAKNVRVMRHDVTAVPLGEDVYDLICARLVLTHLPDPRTVVAKLLRALVPGGRLLLEEYDMRTLPVSDPPDATWSKVAAAPAELLRLGGADPEMGAKLTGMMHAAGATDVDAEAVIMPGRMPEVPSWRAQFHQLREPLIGTGLVTAAELDKVLADFDDESCDRVVYSPALVSVRGRRS